MITCPECNKQLEDGAKFCDSCGTQISETIFCGNCGRQTSMEAGFCQNCGASIADYTETPQEKQKSGISKKWFIGGGGAIVAIAAIWLAVSLFSAGDSNNYGLYMKEGELFYTKIAKLEPWQITTRLIDEDYIPSGEMFLDSYTIGAYCTTSKEGELLFFPDKGGGADGFSLYYRNINKPVQEAYRIDSDITLYAVNEAGTIVTYLKGDDGGLYRHDLKDREKIDSNISHFKVSRDGRKIGYLDDEGKIYLESPGNDREKIAGDIDSLSYISEDIGAFYYIKDASLYKKAEGEDLVKISSDISSIIKIYDSGEAYYLKEKPVEFNLMDYIQDDMKEADAALIAPEKPSYPSAWAYDTSEEYDDAVSQYESAYAAYEEANEAYSRKQMRDSLREELPGQTLSSYAHTLCYYDGTKETVITDSFVLGDQDHLIYYDMYPAAEDTPVTVCKMYDQAAVAKVKLSEVSYESELGNMLRSALYASVQQYVVIRDTATMIEQNAAQKFDIDSDGKTVFFVDDVSEDEEYGNLYKIAISGNKVEKPELYDTDVYIYRYFIANGKYVYYKDVKGDKGELYLNKERVDYDVYPSDIIYDEKNDALVYFIDWDSDKHYGTLKRYSGGKVVKIADDVHSYDLTPGGEVLYLYDYSSKHNRGDLYLYKDGKAREIDNYVSALVPVYDTLYKGSDYYYGW